MHGQANFSSSPAKPCAKASTKAGMKISANSEDGQSGQQNGTYLSRKASAALSPFCSGSENSGTKAALKRLRQIADEQIGQAKGNDENLRQRPRPHQAARKISRIKPVRRLAIVALPTNAALDKIPGSAAPYQAAFDLPRLSEPGRRVGFLGCAAFTGLDNTAQNGA